MSAILRREFATYFRAPLGYIYLAIFYFFGGQFFSQILYYQMNSIETIFSSLFSILMFTIPLLTMRLMSEDKKLKTDQALLTAPVSLNGIVWGKFLAAFALFGIGIAVTVVYFLILSSMATPQWNIFLGNLLGLILLGAALISIGLFISSLTESPVSYTHLPGKRGLILTRRPTACSRCSGSPPLPARWKRRRISAQSAGMRWNICAIRCPMPKPLR